MRLYANEKEAKVLLLALDDLVTEDPGVQEIAQTLLARITRCLQTQDTEPKPQRTADPTRE